MADYINPYLSEEIKSDMRQWERDRGKPAFGRVLQQRMTSDTEFAQGTEPCKNCAGEGSLYVSFCESGPFRAPPGGKTPATYFDGNPMWSEGWYKIEHTVPYTCPHCQGRGSNGRG